MKTLLIASILLLAGCVAPVERQFPNLPPSLEKGCDDLDLVPTGTEKLSEVLIVVTGNYAKYHECQIKVETWQSWYNTQKKIFDSVK
mgnify:CR=1 FL=1|jgi:hypothetical protein